MKPTKPTRRAFLTGSLGVALGTKLTSLGAELRPASPAGPASAPITDSRLESAAAQPVLDLRPFKSPIVIDSIELLRRAGHNFVRVRSTDGAEGVAVDNGRADLLQSIFNQLVVPYFVGKDARALEEHLFGVYRYKSNYKLQGLALWCPVALVEFAILDLLGRISRRSIGQLLGGVCRNQVPVYIASSRRDTTPEQEVAHLRRLLAETGAKAVKYRIGGRMSRNEDSLPGRTERLIPLSRQELGEGVAIHADANSSYEPAEAIRIGRLLEEIRAVYYEEPCPFDHLDATKQVADALQIPIALGEQESSHWRFQFAIRERVADVIQPDLFYYGGLIRSIRVARMAALREIPTTVHISGGFGFVYMLHFASCVSTIGPWQEYKDGLNQYRDWFDPPLRMSDGAITVPDGPGVGIKDPQRLLAEV